MNEKKVFILTLIFDFLLIFCSCFSTTCTLTNCYFMIDVERMATAPYLLTFTGLSNLFIGVVALACLIARLIRKQRELPSWLFIIKLSSVSMIIITLLTTSCYLVPASKDSSWRLYVNSNLFNHLITPVLAIIAFLIFEKPTNIKYRYVPLALIPLLIYSVIYLCRAIPNYDPSREVNLYYDIYGLTRFGIPATIGFLFGFIAAALLFSTILYFLNRLKKRLLKKKNQV